MQNQNSSLCVKNEFDVANVMKSFFNPNKKIFIFKETEIFFIWVESNSKCKTTKH